MIHVIKFFIVSPEKASSFTRTIGPGGIFRELARQLEPGLIAIDLLRSHILESA